MARRKPSVEGRPAIDYRRQSVADNLDVGGANRDCVDPHKHLRGSGLRHGLFDQHQFFRVAEHPRLHGVWDREFVDAVLVHKKSSGWASLGYCSSQTSVKSWPMKWLGVIAQPFSPAEVATMRFHHKSGTV